MHTTLHQIWQALSSPIRASSDVGNQTCESSCKELPMCRSAKPWAELELYGHAPCYRSSWTTSQIPSSTNDESSWLSQLPWLASIHKLQPSCLCQLKTLQKQRCIGLTMKQHGWSISLGTLSRVQWWGQLQECDIQYCSRAPCIPPHLGGSQDCKAIEDKVACSRYHKRRFPGHCLY